MATKPPVWSDYWPKGVTADSFSVFEGYRATDAASYPNLSVSRPSSYEIFVRDSAVPGSDAAKMSAIFGGPEKYKAAADAYRLAYFNWQNQSSPSASSQIALQEETRNQLASAVVAEEKGLPVAKSSESILRDQRYNTIRSELENQYNNLNNFNSAFGYAGRNSDLNAIFNQQAAQLADAGVESIADLRIQDGTLINSKTNKAVTTSNLNGQVAVDRDTGVQKWGDIFSGVEGGANYGIQQMPDGSVILFPAWEKTKSLAAQIGGRELEKWITPLLTIGGAVLAGPIGGSAVAGAAAGAAAGSTAGQLLATGEVDWEKVALSAAGAGAGQYVGGLLGGEEAVAATSPDLSGTTGGMTGADYGFQVGSPGVAVSGGGLTSAEMAALKTGTGYGETTQSLLNQDLNFISADAAQLWKQTGDVAAVQQNLIAAGVDPIMAAEASNLAALGGTTQSIASSLGQAFPGETVFTSEGLLSGGSTMDEFARDIGGDISSSAAPALGIQDALRMARTGMQLFGPQQQQLLGMGGYGGGGGQAAGVDSSGLLGLLQGKAGVPGVAPLLTPVSIPAAQAQPLLGLQMPQYQPLLGTTTQSLLG